MSTPTTTGEPAAFRALRGAPGVELVVWQDSYRGTDRTCRYRGDCIVCRRRTWAFDDGDNDPRGVLGDSALHPLPVEDDEDDREVRACALCGSDYDSYQAAQEIARQAPDMTALAPL